MFVHVNIMIIIFIVAQETATSLRKGAVSVFNPVDPFRADVMTASVC